MYGPLKVNQEEMKIISKSLKCGIVLVDIPAKLIKTGTNRFYEQLRKQLQNCLNGASLHRSGKNL